MALKEISKDKIRPWKKTVGGVISWYATAEKDIKINRKLVFEVLRNFGIGPSGENVHRIKLGGGSLHELRRNGVSESTYEMTDDKVRGFVITIYLDDAGLVALS